MPDASPVDPYTRTEHSGTLLVAEMDRAGVDLALVVGYDGYDFETFMRRLGSSPADFMGGRGYAREWVRRYPERLYYITTLYHPTRDPGYELLNAELAAGAVGIKIFPAYLDLLADSSEIRSVFDMARGREIGIVFGLEDSGNQSPALIRQLEGIARLVEDYPEIPLQLNHGANVWVGTPEWNELVALVTRASNVLVSTSVLGGTEMVWSDGWLYPFPEYRSRLREFVASVPEGQIAWATDWPWFESVAKYPQLLQAVVDDKKMFRSPDAREMFLGRNALRHWRLNVPSHTHST